MRGKVLKILAAALAAVICCVLGIRILEQENVLWNGSLLPKHEQSISVSGRKMRNVKAFLKFTDLRCLDARDTGMTIAQYEWFRQALPDCRVLWDIPVQGKAYSTQTRELFVETLTAEEMEALSYFTELEVLDVGSWSDYETIRTLQARYPECSIRYRVSLGGEQWDADVASILLTDADGQELMEKLRWFEDPESVLLTGAIPEQDTLRRLQDQYPEITFLWKWEELGLYLEADATALDLREVPLGSVEVLESLMACFPHLERVELDSGGLEQDRLIALAEKYPHIRFLFDLTFGGRSLYTGAEEIDLSDIPMDSAEAVEAILPCFRDLKTVVMCRCGISSEEMDALNQKYDDIRFVWSVELAGKELRTDAEYFTPNKWGISCDDENIADLRYCRDMVCVDIGHHIKVTNCEWVRDMPKLKYLILAETGISDLTPLENHESLIYLEIFLSKVTDYSPLTTCKALEDLNLCYTQGDPEPIGEMTWLKRLWWAGCWVGRTYLADKLPDTDAEYLSLSSTGRGWREGQHYYDMRDFIGMDYMTG